MPEVQAREVLRRVFGFDTWRGRQQEVIEHVMAGGDCLVLMPTGGGKSLCYQIPAICRPGVGVVISPLIALMTDQVLALRQASVRAAALNSTLSAPEAARIRRRMLRGELDLVYVSPERLFQEGFLDFLGRCPLALFAIDEAHCVSQWGHDFRPEYLQLRRLKPRFEAVPILALTATADAPTRADILPCLGLDTARVFATGFDRPNIRYQVAAKDRPRDQLVAFIEAEHQGQAGIVYCLTRAKVDLTARWLAEQGLPALPYHAGLDKDTRRRHQDHFVLGDTVVMVATVAFGLGIDKPDVRFVAHLDLPSSLESYYQETGRAGRDGLAADAWMVYGLSDVIQQQRFIDASDADEHHRHVARQKLEALLGYGETSRCRRQVLLEYFGDECRPCGNCDTCLDPPHTFDGTVAAQKALSCVFRTGQKFGARHVISVLLGRDSDRIRRWGHHRLSTHGVGREFTARQWYAVFRQLVALGLLVVDSVGHGGLSLGPGSRDVLSHRRKVRLRLDPVQPRPPKSGKRASRRAAAEALDRPEDEALFEALRARRRELADEQGVPAFVIFHDSSLMDMVRRRPRTQDEFAAVSGVGQVKLERYADDFLAVIVRHCAETSR
ncbi:MAG: DNA helicase RecQ [Proteobacteria bacterium]|nr:DNA helicase RecQ [Pseudomonadota bacterium]